jgi:hypothetical protein
MRGGAVAGQWRRGRPPDGAHYSRRAGLQECKSFVEMCVVSCLRAETACACGRGAATWARPNVRNVRCELPCRQDGLQIAGPLGGGGRGAPSPHTSRPPP